MTNSTPTSVPSVTLVKTSKTSVAKVVATLFFKDAFRLMVEGIIPSAVFGLRATTKGLIFVSKHLILFGLVAVPFLWGCILLPEGADMEILHVAFLAFGAVWIFFQFGVFLDSHPSSVHHHSYYSPWIHIHLGYVVFYAVKAYVTNLHQRALCYLRNNQ